MPDEVSEEICPQCGRNLVVKSGRFGRFLACPGWPECDFTMPLVVEMPGKCPKCGGRLLKRTGKSKKTGKQYTYYCCERVNSKDEARKCDFMTWDVPVKDNCPVCGWTMFKKPGQGGQEALLRQRGLLQLHPRGEAGRLAEKAGLLCRYRRGEGGEEARGQKTGREEGGHC